MRKSCFSEEQIIGIPKEHQAGIGARELCRKHGVSDGTYYKWRSKYGCQSAVNLDPRSASQNDPAGSLG